MTLQLHSEMQEVLLKEKEISMCQGKKVQKAANSVKKARCIMVWKYALWYFLEGKVYRDAFILVYVKWLPLGKE